MKRNLLFLLSLTFTLVILSCGNNDDPVPVVEDPSIALKETKVDFTNEAGVKTISFETNKSWTAKSDEAWCELSPTSGGVSVKSITVTVAANDTYDDRNCNVTITAGSLSKTIAINQSQQNAIILTEKIHNLSSESHTLKVKLQSNVEFEVIIPKEAQDWVFKTDTRALKPEVLTLSITENESSVIRTSRVYIRDKSSSLEDTLFITQEGKELVYVVDKRGTLGEILNQTQKDTITTMIVRGGDKQG